MDAIPISQIKWADECLLKRSDDEVQRLIILDGPNIMHCTKVEGETAGDLDGATITGLVVLMRFFLMKDFDVVALISAKYSRKHVLQHSYQKIKELEDLNLICIVEENTLDDLILLETAKSTDGLVLSRDQFKDHYATSERYMALVTGNSSVIEFNKVPADSRHTMTSNGHYVSDHTVLLPSRDLFFSTPRNIRHELVTEYRRNWSVERKQMLLRKIDSILLKIREIEIAKQTDSA